MTEYFSQGFGIDLGTANTVIYERGQGITLNEPSVVAVRPDKEEIIAIGRDAKNMLGKTPGDIIAVRPLKDGVIADMEMAEIMLKHFLRRAMEGKPRFLRYTTAVICVPAETTAMERRAVEEAAHQAGARETILLEEPIAAAMGAGIDVTRARGRMIVDIGGGTTEAAVLSLGGIVVRKSLRTGGHSLDVAICEYVREKYNVYIGEATAEHIKLKIGSATEFQGELTVRGRSLISGLPAEITVTAEDARHAMEGCISRIIAAVKAAVEITPPELASDVLNDGILLSGGSSQLRGLEQVISRATGIPVMAAPDPMESVARGAGKAVERLTEERSSAFSRLLQRTQYVRSQ